MHFQAFSHRFRAKIFTKRCFLQVKSSLQLTESCAALKNKGVYFTARLCVGTPSQCFDVVADTGSDNVIITSCVCNDLLGATDECTSRGLCHMCKRDVYDLT